VTTTGTTARTRICVQTPLFSFLQFTILSLRFLFIIIIDDTLTLPVIV